MRYRIVSKPWYSWKNRWQAFLMVCFINSSSFLQYIFTFKTAQFEEFEILGKSEASILLFGNSKVYKFECYYWPDYFWGILKHLFTENTFYVSLFLIIIEMFVITSEPITISIASVLLDYLSDLISKTWGGPLYLLISVFFVLNFNCGFSIQ